MKSWLRTITIQSIYWSNNTLIYTEGIILLVKNANMQEYGW